MADDTTHEPVGETPDALPAPADTPPVVPVPNYHIVLWPEPPGTPPTYLCLLCAYSDATHAAVQAHVTDVHALAPVPTPLAAHPPILEEATGLLVVPSQEGHNDG